MQREIAWKGLRLDVPSDWDALHQDDALLVFPKQCRQQVEEHAPCDSVHIRVLEGAPDNLDAIVASAMARRVKQGAAEAGTSVVAGRTTLQRVWSDGVAQVVSNFLVHRGRIYEVQRTEPWIRTAGTEHLAIAAKALCSTGIVAE